MALSFEVKRTREFLKTPTTSECRRLSRLGRQQGPCQNIAQRFDMFLKANRQVKQRIMDVHQRLFFCKACKVLTGYASISKTIPEATAERLQKAHGKEVLVNRDTARFFPLFTCMGDEAKFHEFAVRICLCDCDRQISLALRSGGCDGMLIYHLLGGPCRALSLSCR